ncbi:MAG: hypothetical protein ACR2O4_06205, partial [Hyphomicrobiaceae bacterium]
MSSVQRLLIAFAFCLTLLCGTSGGHAAQPAEPLSFNAPQGLVDWITAYRHAPEPARVPEAVQAMSRLGLFKDSQSAAFYIGFIAGVIGGNQVHAPQIVDDLFPLPPSEQAVIIKAIAYSGLPGWKELLQRFIGHMPARKVLIRKYLFEDGKTLADVPLDNGNAVVDTLWGYYFATGSYVPVLRIMDALEWTAEKENTKRIVIGNMAMVTLASNGARDENLLSLYHVQIPYRRKAAIEPLRQVVNSIETFETHKIREQAQQAIRDAQSRGPAPKTSKWGTASRIGQTVLSVGCVVAGALGHPEVAAPCIITGALYSGATNLAKIGSGT